MRRMPSIAAGFALNSLPETAPPIAKPSIFGAIIEALHHSRRLQAERTLHQYRHLIHEPQSNILGELIKGYGGMDHVR